MCDIGDKRLGCLSVREVKGGEKASKKFVVIRDHVLLQKEMENFFQEVNMDDL